MPRPSLTIEHILTLLTATPQRLATLTTDLTPTQLRTRPAPDEWSANDILAHLRSCADVWGGRIATILAEDCPTIRAINPTTWILQTDYPTLDFASSLHAFTVQRADLLAILEPLPHAAWSRTATITGAGKPTIRTLQSYAESLAIHERPHLKHIARLLTTLRR